MEFILVFSQLKSAFQAMTGDMEAATKTQQQFIDGCSAIPVVSQVKSAVQASLGDMEGATKTQHDFTRQCVGVSQVRSLVEASLGDADAATATQLEFINGPGLKQAAVVVGAAMHAQAMVGAFISAAASEGCRNTLTSGEHHPSVPKPSEDFFLAFFMFQA
ncbi:hypothetical protein HDV00_004599 [Rhizophlyctis rosea]|nr:hypothetical protein HDV00_004599 [Rhizophlyctis rosea]